MAHPTGSRYTPAGAAHCAATAGRSPATVHAPTTSAVNSTPPHRVAIGAIGVIRVIEAIRVIRVIEAIRVIGGPTT
nr:hypothetical protein GCM10020241_07500 [Streptoalloteichus tenebrarius]